MKSLIPHEKFPLYYLEWIDAESDSAWGDKDSIDKWLEKDFIVHDLGWIVSDNRKYLVICNQISVDGDLGNRTRIPKKWIRLMRKVRLVTDESSPGGRHRTHPKKHSTKKNRH